MLFFKVWAYEVVEVVALACKNGTAYQESFYIILQYKSNIPVSLQSVQVIRSCWDSCNLSSLSPQENIQIQEIWQCSINARKSWPKKLVQLQKCFSSSPFLWSLCVPRSAFFRGQPCLSQQTHVITTKLTNCQHRVSD